MTNGSACAVRGARCHTWHASMVCSECAMSPWWVCWESRGPSAQHRPAWLGPFLARQPLAMCRVPGRAAERHTAYVTTPAPRLGHGRTPSCGSRPPRGFRSGTGCNQGVLAMDTAAHAFADSREATTYTVLQRVLQNHCTTHVLSLLAALTAAMLLLVGTCMQRCEAEGVEVGTL